MYTNESLQQRGKVRTLSRHLHKILKVPEFSLRAFALHREGKSRFLVFGDIWPQATGNLLARCWPLIATRGGASHSYRRDVVHGICPRTARCCHRLRGIDRYHPLLALTRIGHARQRQCPQQPVGLHGADFRIRPRRAHIRTFGQTGALRAGHTAVMEADSELPPIVDHATWQSQRDALLLKEKAHTRAGDDLAAQRRRLPMVEFDGWVTIEGPTGAVPFVDLFGAHDELLVYGHMWWDGAPHQGQCEGCTTVAWHMQAVSPYLEARGVATAIVTSGAWHEVEPYVAFMGYHEPWFSTTGADVPIGGEMGYLRCFLRSGNRTFLTYETTGRGIEPAVSSFALLDMTYLGRAEAWQDNPPGRSADHDPGWFWRTDSAGNATWGPTGRPTPQWTRPGASQQDHLGRGAHHH